MLGQVKYHVNSTSVLRAETVIVPRQLLTPGQSVVPDSCEQGLKISSEVSMQ
jgi:hypothetical protein